MNFLKRTEQRVNGTINSHGLTMRFFKISLINTHVATWEVGTRLQKTCHTILQLNLRKIILRLNYKIRKGTGSIKE